MVSAAPAEIEILHNLLKLSLISFSNLNILPARLSETRWVLRKDTGGRTELVG